MIHYITRQTMLETGGKYILSPFSKLVDWIKKREIIALDTETKGFDFTKDILLLQLGDKADQFVINFQEFAEETLQLLKDNKHKQFIIHHAQFDLRFLIYRGVYLRNIFDTCVAEKVIKNGIFLDTRGEYASASLQYVSKKYLGIYLSKEERGKIHKGITTEVIVYAGKDVAYLHDIKFHQMQEAVKKELTNSIYLQNKYVSVLARQITNGIYIDYTNRWLPKVQKYKIRLAQLKETLNVMVINEPRLADFVTRQLDMFNPPSCKVNWASSKQVIPFMKSLGVDTQTKDKKTGKIKDSVEAKQLEKYKNLHPVIGVYFEYKEVEKELSTYGENWIKYINPITGRVHTDFNQYIATGRMSSGSKDGGPNLQNLPSDKETRACFMAQRPGWKFLSADYSNQEGYICAELSQDPVLKDIFNNNGDIHCITATAISHIFLGETTEVTKDNNVKNSKGVKLRDIAKTVNFGIQYLCMPPTLAKGLNCSIEEARSIHKATIEKFKRRHQFFEEVFLEAMKTGYIQFNPVIKSKFFIQDWQWLKDVASKYNARYVKEEFKFEFQPPYEVQRKFFMLVSTIKRYCANYPIQGSSGDLTKIAAIYIDDWIEDNNLSDKILGVNAVHDELCYELHPDIAEEASIKVVELMNKAADIFCKTVKLTADPALGEHWIK